MLNTRLYNETENLNFKTMYMNTYVQCVYINPPTNTYDFILFSVS
jgi:hypothetical protein